MDEEELDVPLNSLEYRPSFQITERERTAWERTEVPAEAPMGSDDDTVNIGSGLGTEVIMQVKEAGKQLENKRNDLSVKLAKKEIVATPKQLGDIASAKEALGLKEGPFLFSDYEAALTNRYTAAGDYLVEVAERYFEGVDGNLELELFQDYLELLEEHAIIDQYLKRVFSPIYEGLNWDLPEEEFEEMLLQKETDWGKKKADADLRKNERDASYRNAFIRYPERLEREKQLRYLDEPLHQTLANEHARMEDALLISQNKSREMLAFLRNATSMEETGWSKSEKESIERTLTHITEESDWETNLTQTTVMLTVAVDNENKEKHHMKHSLRNTYAPEKQARILDEWSLYQELYEKDVLPLIHRYNAIDEEVPPAATLFLESITSAMGDVTKEKEARLLDFQNIQQSTSELRKAKLRAVSKKEEARKGYQLLKETLEGLGLR